MGLPWLSGVVLAAVFLILALAFSAPAVLAPPTERSGGLEIAWSVPFPVAIALYFFKAFMWLGDKILVMLWTGVFRVWDGPDGAPA